MAWSSACTQKYGELDPGIGLTSSITQDPMPPVEYDRDAAASQIYNHDSSGAEIPDQGS